MKRARSVLAGLALAPVFACGGSPAFPDELSCVTPAPVATSRSSPGSISTQAYVNRVRTVSDTIFRLRESLRAKYDDDTFYRREEFRPDFAEYSKDTICTARALIAVEAPGGSARETKTSLDSALAALIAHTEFGREAVRARNVSDYREWYAGVDARVQAVRAAANAVR